MVEWHGVGLGRQAGDAVGFRLAAEKIDEMQAAVAPPLLERDKLGRGRERAVLVLRRDHAVLLHAAEHIGEPFLGAIRMTVGIEEAWPLEQARQHRAFGQLRSLADLPK